MTIHARDVSGIAVLEVDGRLTSGIECRDFNQAIKSLVSANKTNILVNLEELRYIDSCGVGELIAGLTTVKKGGGTFKLACPQDKVQQIFDIVRLAEVVEIYPNQSDALSSFA